MPGASRGLYKAKGGRYLITKSVLGVLYRYHDALTPSEYRKRLEVQLATYEAGGDGTILSLAMLPALEWWVKTGESNDSLKRTLEFLRRQSLSTGVDEYGKQALRELAILESSESCKEQTPNIVSLRIAVEGMMIYRRALIATN